MVRKVYDILPPKSSKKTKNQVGISKNTNKPVYNTEKSSLKKEKNIYQNEISSKKTKSFSIFKKLFFVLGCVLILFTAYLFVSLPEATIEISPQIEVLSFEEKISIDKSVDSVNLSDKIIPAFYIENEQTLEQEFLATGIKSNDGKATGVIRVYNKINPPIPFTLIKGTRFLSDSGKIFTINEKIIIPAAQYKQGKLVPGFIDVTAEARETGEEFNIEPSTFSIPGLSGTASYHSIYGESGSPMKGGFTGSVKQVTKDDIEQAESLLTKKLLNQIEESLREKLSSKDVLLDSAISKNIISAISSVNAEEIGDKFNLVAKAKILALVFKKEDIEKIIKEKIVSQLPQDKNFLQETLVVEYDPQIIDIQKGSAEINLKTSVDTYYSIDSNNLINSFGGKSPEQIKEVIDSIYGSKISELNVNLWPFWATQAPKNQKKIKINLVFEKK